MAQTYSISDLERLTGIKAHTIRIWEKRYGLLTPARTDTNIRTYSDEDLRKILNVNTLMRGGWKISRISKLTGQELESQVWNSARSGHSTEQVYEIYTQALISAALTFDEEWFDNVYADVATRFGLTLTMQHVIGPFLNRIGLMWTVLRMHPGQEHFASNVIRRKLLSAIDRLPGLTTGKKFLLFLPGWEEHEIGLIYAWYLLKSAGHRVIYLGQRVPVEALLQTISTVQPHILLTFLVTEQPASEIQDYLQAVSSPDTTVYVGARSELIPALSNLNRVKIIASPEELIKLI